MNKIRHFFWSLLLFCAPLFAVPLSFLRAESGNQRDVIWALQEDNLFKIYYDEKYPNLARAVQEALQQGYPPLASLLGVQFSGAGENSSFVTSPEERIVVVVGNRSEGVGFANPVSLNIEVLFQQWRGKAFLQHELVHRLMYEHHRFQTGLVGRTLSLLFMPTWWIEGLAEFLTESVGRLETSGLERAMTLQNFWPSWDRLHSLYNGVSADDQRRGYVTSGRFTGFLYGQLKPKSIAQVHAELSAKTASFPFAEAAERYLQENLGANSKDIYSTFQEEEKRKWENYLADMPLLQASSRESSFVSLSPQWVAPPRLVHAFEKATAELEKSWEFATPVRLTLLPNSQSATLCQTYIVDFDDEMTSLEQSCPGKKERHTILAKGKVYLKGGYVKSTGDFRLLVGWDKLLGIVDFSPQQKRWDVLAAFPEWIEKIQPLAFDAGSDDRFFGAWKYERGQYRFIRVDSLKLQENFSYWQRKRTPASPFWQFPGKHSFSPPYVAILKNSAVVEQPLAFHTQEQKSTGEAAPVHSRFLFLLPYGTPDILGGVNIGFFGIPLMDEIERYKLQASFTYDTFTHVPGGKLSYINERVWDNLTLNAFSMPRFNGYFTTHEDSFFTYLRQTGVSLALDKKLIEKRLLFQPTLSLVKLTELPLHLTIPPSVGAQNSYLASLRLVLSFSLFQYPLFFAQENPLHSEEMLLWKTRGVVSFTENLGLGEAHNSLGKSAGHLHYQNMATQLESEFSLFAHSLSFIGYLSTTQGPNTLNLREVYSPYMRRLFTSETLQGSMIAPLYGSGSLFSLIKGDWSFAGSAAYRFPLFKGFERKLYFAFADRWEGEMGVARGGVALEPQFGAFRAFTSIFLGTKMRFDMKGFQVTPSLYYGKLLSQSQWYLYTQLTFSDFF